MKLNVKRILHSSVVVVGLSISAFADNYEVTVSTRTVKKVDACMLGTPDKELVRMCVDGRRYGLFWEDVGYGWYLEPMFQDENNPLGKCACNTFDAKKAKDRVKVKRRITAEKVEYSESPKGYIAIGEIEGLTKTIRKNKKRVQNTKIVCVKCDI